jgi:hypothetical protein
MMNAMYEVPSSSKKNFEVTLDYAKEEFFKNSPLR